MFTLHSRHATLASLSFSTLATLALTHTAHAADEQLEEVTVTALAFRASIDDAIQPVEVLSGDELQQQLSSSIGETLAKQPGITATYFGPNASRPIIRGLSGERVMMLEDSLSALDVSSLSEDHAVSIEDSLASQIEIVKGPSALLYGSGAVGGVVNVLTDRIPEQAPARALSGQASLRADTATDERSGSAALNLGNEHVAVHVDGYSKKTDDVEVPNKVFSDTARDAALDANPAAFIPEGRLYNSASDSKGGAAGVSLLGDRGFIGVSVSGFDTVYGVPLAPGEDPADGGPSIDMKQTRVDLKGELRGDDGWFKTLRVRAARNDYQHAEKEPDGAVGTLFNQIGTEARVSVDHQFGALQGNAGVQYKHLDFSALGDERFVPPSVTNSTGLFVFEQLPLDPLTLQGGVRVEHQRITPDAAASLPHYSDNATSLSVGGLWKLQEDHSLAINLTRSERMPTATELYADGAHEATGQFVIGDAALGKETSNGIDVIWRGGDVLHWHVSAYYNQFSNYIYLQPTGAVEDGLPVYEYRQAKARYVGAEAAVRWHVYEQGDSHLDIQLSADAVRASLADGSAVPQIPPLRVGVELNYAAGNWISTLSAFRYAKQDRVAENETPTDGYTLVDASISREWSLTANSSLTTFLKGSNLTDATARRHTSPLKEYAPLPGRSATLGVTVKF
jgi:iron complex outermembrane recepter protein